MATLSHTTTKPVPVRRRDPTMRQAAPSMGRQSLGLLLVVVWVAALLLWGMAAGLSLALQTCSLLAPCR